jgi:tRNA 2-thiouridine synthesizing protein B
MLHLIFAAPVTNAILARVGAADEVVFLENAVLAIVQHNVLTNFALLNTGQCYVLADDLAVRGITANELRPSIQVINYAEFVALSVKHPTSQSWT